MKEEDPEQKGKSHFRRTKIGQSPGPVPEQDWRRRFLKSNLSLPAGRVPTTKKAAPTRHDHCGHLKRPKSYVRAARNTFPSRELCTSGCWMNSTGETCWQQAKRR